MSDEQKIIEDYFRKMNREIDHRTWLYKIGLQETHEILYIIAYGRGFKKYG